ncbi:MAG TPA: SCP2 sterol-binding domain-containing protein [Candidatus Competibacteraceae bacterium]|nr:SCP2 sterol-binding domain-containing protein [Candidatus Competibacteraceae bacterium]
METNAASRHPPTLPHWLGWPLRHLPGPPPGVLALLNRVFAPVITRGELEFLRGRVLLLEISDLGLELPLTVLGQHLHAPRGVQTDAHIAGRAYDFLQLAAGRADPDTLFFQRRLRMQGDTELGLAVKNLLAGLDPAELLPGPLYKALQGAAGLAASWAE